MEGSYSGKVAVFAPVPKPQIYDESDTDHPAAETDVKAKVEKDTIYFDKFPTDYLITAIVGEEKAPEVIETVGDIGYKVGHKSAFNEDYTRIEMTMDPKPLTFTFETPAAEEGGEPEVVEVEVTVAAKEKAVFAYENNNLNFNLTIEQVKLNGEELDASIVEELAFSVHKQ